jgi:hypothetical protein
MSTRLLVGQHPETLTQQTEARVVVAVQERRKQNNITIDDRPRWPMHIVPKQRHAVLHVAAMQIGRDVR